MGIGAFNEMGSLKRRRVAEGSRGVLVGSQKFLLGLLSWKCLLNTTVKKLSWQLDSKPGAQEEVWESGFLLSVWESWAYSWYLKS